MIDGAERFSSRASAVPAVTVTDSLTPATGNSKSTRVVSPTVANTSRRS